MYHAYLNFKGLCDCELNCMELSKKSLKDYCPNEGRLAIQKHIQFGTYLEQGFVQIICKRHC